MKFEEKLQSLRKKSNLSQEALADKLGVSRQAVSKWESGTSYPEMDKLIMMSKIFKCTLDDLVNDEVKDKDVLEREVNKKNGYFNSFVNGIANSIKMFSSMKAISVIKCLFELFFFALFLFIVTAVINAILVDIVESITVYSRIDNIICFIVLVFYFMFMVILVVTDFIVFFLFYKIRYLDYYNQVSYSVSQAEEIEGDIPNENKRIRLNSKAPKIILKRPKERKTSTINILYDVVKALAKVFLTIICSYILLFIIIIFILLCISVYLIFYNSLFIGIAICILCVTIISVYLFILMVRCIIDKKNKLMPFIITLIVSVCLFGFGFSLSLINFKDISIMEDEYKVKEINIDYQDNLIISSNTIEYKYIDSEEIKVYVNYIDGLNEYEYEIDNNVHTFDIDYLDENPLKGVDIVLKNLKNNKIISYSNNDSITVRASKENIKKIIQNTSKYRRVDDYEEFNDSIYVVYGRYIHTNSFCDLNKAGFYNCYDVSNKSQCDILIKNGNILADDSSKCRCYHAGDYDYVCYDKSNS